MIGKISGSEFARRCGVSPAAVNKAIAAGHIRAGLTRSDTGVLWLDEAVAKSEWLQTIIPRSSNEQLRARLAEPATSAPALRRPEKAKQVKAKPKPTPKSKPKEPKPQKVVQPEPEPEPEPEPVLPQHLAKQIQPEPAATPAHGTSLAEAKRAKELLHVKRLKFEVDEMEGRLVDKARVYRALFAFGSELRQKIMQVPDQVVDDVLAARTRNESHAILQNALADALELLSDAQSLNFGND